MPNPSEDMQTDDTEDTAAIAPGLPGPAYPAQPVDGERPVPLRRMSERTQDPADWDVPGSTEPSRPREPDEVLARRRADEEAARQGSGAGRDDAPTADVEGESAYSTEIEQGAAAPRKG